MYHLGYPILESVAQPAIKSRGGDLLVCICQGKKEVQSFINMGGTGMTRGQF